MRAVKSVVNGKADFKEISRVASSLVRHSISLDKPVIELISYFHYFYSRGRDTRIASLMAVMHALHPFNADGKPLHISIIPFQEFD
jgi:hypothetical protein